MSGKEIRGRGQGPAAPTPSSNSHSPTPYRGLGGEFEGRAGDLQSPGPPLKSNRTVIFTADDFGLSPALNGAVALAHRRGLLRCASLMAAGPAVAEAVRLARELPGLCLGVHLTLIQGRAVLPPQEIPRLVDPQGRFLHNPVQAGWRYFWEPRLLPEIKRELRAQIETVLKEGLTVWHLNGHVNLHLHPRIFPLVAELAREYGIPAVRLAREDWRATLALAPDGPLPKIAQGLIFTLLCCRAERLARAAGLIYNDHLFGLLNDGRLTEPYLLGLVPLLQPGVTEIYCHPGLSADPELKRWAPDYRRQEELAALLSPRLREALAGAGVEVSDFRALSLTGGKSSGSGLDNNSAFHENLG
jgi:hopanoid biosynthesis associated protein HpnK